MLLMLLKCTTSTTQHVCCHPAPPALFLPRVCRKALTVHIVLLAGGGADIRGVSDRRQQRKQDALSQPAGAVQARQPGEG